MFKNTIYSKTLIVNLKYLLISNVLALILIGLFVYFTDIFVTLNIKSTLVLFLIFIFTTILGIFLATKKNIQSILSLVAMAKKLKKTDSNFYVDENEAEEIIFLQKNLISFSKLLNERELMRSTFSRYISNYIADEILTDDLIEPMFLAEYREVTILFSDIRGFTTISETLEPKDLFEILNSYFDQMIDIVIKNNGVINKFIGDALMVIYNAPQFCEFANVMAVITAFEMNKKLENFNQECVKKFNVKLGIGIGINSGQVVVGNIGSKKRMEYTVIGDAVNVSSRLQSVAKSGEIIVSENVYKEVQYVFKLEDMGTIELKGKRQPLRVYKVIDILDYKSIKENIKKFENDSYILQLCLIALKKIENLNLEQDLMPFLKNNFEKIRYMALELIIERFRNKAEECIMYVLQNDKSEFVKMYAIEKIGSLGLTKFTNYLSNQYLQSQSLRLRGATIHCLYNLNDQKLKDKILELIKSEEIKIYEEIKNVFDKYNKYNLYEIIDMMLSENSVEKEQKLGVYLISILGLSAKVELLNRLFRDCNDNELRKLVVNAYLKIGNCKSVIFMLKNLNKFEKERLNNAYKIIAHLIAKYHNDEYKHDLSIKIQLDIIKNLILSSEGKNFEKLKVALVKNK